MGTLRIRLFGTLDMESDDSVARLPSKKVKDFFSYLLLNRDMTHTRERLAGLFWGDMDEHKARHCLNTTLWRLNSYLTQPATRAHPWLHVDAQRLGVDVGGDVWLDVAEFEQRCAWAAQVPAASPQQAALYRQAVELYRADLLVDCDEEWCLVERRRLQRLYTRALGQLVAYHTGRDEHEAAIDCAQHFLAYDPLREAVHRDLIRLYLAAGQPAAALRQYHACEELLRREMGAEPMPETRALLALIVGVGRPDARAEDQRSTRLRETPTGKTAPDEALRAALTHMQRALAAVADAYAQLQRTATLLEGLAGELDGSSTSIIGGARPGKPAVVQRIQQVAQLVGEVAHDLEAVS